MTQLTTCTVALLLSVILSVVGGTCRLEIISIPNGDVLEGDFELISGSSNHA